MYVKKYIAAISGGPDSMAMLNMYKNKISLVLHVNYNKREKSYIDENIVKDFCNKNKINFKSLNLNQDDYEYYFKKYKTNNFQSLARKIRYDYFLENFNEKMYKGLLVAHNLDDHVETYLMQKERDSLSLFFGIKSKTHYKNMKIHRPLLIYRKQTLERYCKENQVEYVLDYSNDLDLYRRNVIRKDISKLSSDEFYNILIEIKRKNKKLKKPRKYVDKFMIRWRHNNYSIEDFKSAKNIYLDNIVFEYLKKIDGLKISQDKIILVRNHLLYSKKNSFLNLGRLKYLKIENKKISIYEGENKNEVRF
jgi:tRNA(Ile)-lysidine synthase